MEVLENSRSDKDALAAHYETVSKVEKYFPSLTRLAFKMTYLLREYAKKYRVNTWKIEFGKVGWTSDGYFTFHVEHDQFDLSEKKTPAFLVRGYDHLPKVAEEYPQVVDLVFRIMHQLAPLMNEMRIRPDAISFDKLHFFTHPDTGREMIAFRIKNYNVPMGWKRVGL